MRFCFSRSLVMMILLLCFPVMFNILYVLGFQMFSSWVYGTCGVETCFFVICDVSFVVGPEPDMLFSLVLAGPWTVLDTFTFGCFQK